MEIERGVADKLTASKEFIAGRSGPLHVSVVFAMYKEHERILSPDVNPIGEDFVNVKVNQLRALFDGDDGWDLVMVDDGCPDGSGSIAERIIEQEGYQNNARVLYIADAIEQGHPVVSGLKSPDESRKGGAVEYGMYEAAQRQLPGHVIVYTDADLSTHLGQIGLLVDALDRGAICAAGSRREPDSVVVKSGERNDRGKIFIYLWKQMLPQLRGIIDSQCGFKGFSGALVPELVQDTVEKQFAFDIELLLRSELRRPESITKVAVAWIDSEAASTTTDLEPYLDMLKGIVKIARKYLQPDAAAEEIAEFIQSLTEESWQQLVENVPDEIASREPYEFGSYHEIRAADLKARIA